MPPEGKEPPGRAEMPAGLLLCFGASSGMGIKGMRAEKRLGTGKIPKFHPEIIRTATASGHGAPAPKPSGILARRGSSPCWIFRWDLGVKSSAGILGKGGDEEGEQFPHPGGHRGGLLCPLRVALVSPGGFGGREQGEDAEFWLPCGCDRDKDTLKSPQFHIPLLGWALGSPPEQGWNSLGIGLK